MNRVLALLFCLSLGLSAQTPSPAPSEAAPAPPAPVVPASPAPAATPAPAPAPAPVTTEPAAAPVPVAAPVPAATPSTPAALPPAPDAAPATPAMAPTTPAPTPGATPAAALAAPGAAPAPGAPAEPAPAPNLPLPPIQPPVVKVPVVPTLPPGSPPNIIVMLIDDMGWTDLGCYGSKYYETPNIDQLAKDGMRFTQAYSACTVCSPTRAALLTGKSPARLHITDWIAGHVPDNGRLVIPKWTMHLPLEEETLAERLKTKGYATASIGKWHLGGEEFAPTKQGFDVNVGGTDKGSPPSYFSPYKIATLKDGPKDEFLSDRLTDEALKFIGSNKAKPFFVYLPHYAVHTPIMGKPEVVAKYQAKAAQQGHSNPVYAALVESVDDSVGKLRAKLQELKLTENTIFIFTSDNGGLSHQVRPEGWSRGPTDNSPARLGKGSAYDGGVHIPLIVSWPGLVKPGSTCDTPVISYDHVPTLLAATQTPLKKDQIVDGESLLPLLGETDTLAREAIYWHYPHYHPGSAKPYSAIREGDWKLIQFHEDNHVELYNLKLDAGEADNRASFDAVKAMQLRQKLQIWLTESGAQIPEQNPKYDPDKPLNEPRKGGAGKKKDMRE